MSYWQMLAVGAVLFVSGVIGAIKSPPLTGLRFFSNVVWQIGLATCVLMAFFLIRSSAA